MSIKKCKFLVVIDMFLGAICFSYIGEYALAIVVILAYLFFGILLCLKEKK